MKHQSSSLQKTEEIANAIAKTLGPEKNSATVLGLYGDLGSGKTTFTQALARAFGVTETVTSPTFILEKIYKLENQNFSHLIHIDAYRFETSDELLKLGWKEITENKENLIVVEWPERVVGILPKNIQKIRFTFIDTETREIETETEVEV
jgi:tRNA threonylcarbamoyladenosine biosynthesis protein TsaE